MTMCRKLSPIAAATILAVGVGSILADDGKRLPAPLEGAVSHGMALAEARESDTGTSACLAPLNGNLSGQKKLALGGLGSLPVRWHVGQGHFWPVGSLPYLDPTTGERQDRDCNAEELGRYRLADVLQGKLTADSKPYEDAQFTHIFAAGGPLRDIHSLNGHLEYELQLHYDYLPVAEDKVLLFVLTDARGHLEAAGTTGDLSAAHIVISPDEAKAHHWSMTVFSCRNSWDADKQEWFEFRWKLEDSIEVGFKEGFNVLGQGDDYYFVTVSGNVYRAPKPDKGADRKMEALWDDAKRPVVSFITDADADRTFLFCKPDKDGKGVYFEMSDKPDPQPYDASKVLEAKADDPLPAVLAYAKILLADKKIKDKQ